MFLCLKCLVLFSYKCVVGEHNNDIVEVGWSILFNINLSKTKHRIKSHWWTTKFDVAPIYSISEKEKSFSIIIITNFRIKAKMIHANWGVYRTSTPTPLWIIESHAQHVSFYGCDCVTNRLFPVGVAKPTICFESILLFFQERLESPIWFAVNS